MRVSTWTIVMALAAGCAGTPRGQTGASKGGESEVEATIESGVLPLFQRAAVSGVKISPDGTHFAMIIDAGHRLAFFRVSDNTMIAHSALPLEFKASPSEDNIFTRLEWVSERRIVAEVAYYDASLVQPEPRAIISVDVGGGEARYIFGPSAPAGFGQRMTGVYGTIGGLLKTPDHIWVHAQNPNVESLSEVYDVDAATGERKLLSDGPRRVVQYIVDEEGEVRAAAVLGDAGVIENYLREGEVWTKWETKARPLGYSALRRALYVVNEDKQGPALFAVDPTANQWTEIARVPRVEPKTVLFDPRDGSPVAVEHEPDYPVWKIIDESRPAARILQFALTKFAGWEVALENITAGGRLGVVRVRSDRSPGEYFLVNLDEKTVTSIVKLPAHIEETQLGTTEAFRIRASDGAELHGYLTMPSGPNKTFLPMVVLPHAGPRWRDHWSFDPQAQFFASNGFAVLRVNYRGSAGYGADFADAAHGNWGDRVPDDIIDATRWAIAEKIAHPKRICTFGAGFGGYAAVQATIRATDLFRCAVGYSGFYDLAKLAENPQGGEPRRRCKKGTICHISYFNEVSLFEQTSDLGEPSELIQRAIGSDEKKLLEGSPARNAAKLPAPVLLIHGGLDQRVLPSQPLSLRDAMKLKGKTCELLMTHKERHGFAGDENRTEAYQRALAFIRKHTR